MPTTLSAVIRVTDLSISEKAYHATALAPPVSIAMAPKARNNFALMPRAVPRRAAGFEALPSSESDWEASSIAEFMTAIEVDKKRELLSS
jgi:hypothetical protein